MATSWRHKTAIPPRMGSLLPVSWRSHQQWSPAEPLALWTEDHSPRAAASLTGPSQGFALEDAAGWEFIHFNVYLSRACDSTQVLAGDPAMEKTDRACPQGLKF